MRCPEEVYPKPVGRSFQRATSSLSIYEPESTQNFLIPFVFILVLYAMHNFLVSGCFETKEWDLGVDGFLMLFAFAGYRTYLLTQPREGTRHQLLTPVSTLILPVVFFLLNLEVNIVGIGTSLGAVILLKAGLPMLECAATMAFILLIGGLNSVFQSVLLGKLPLVKSQAFMFGGGLGALLGCVCVKHYLDRAGRQSTLVFVLAGISVLGVLGVAFELF